jgi:hypothetical protein
MVADNPQLLVNFNVDIPDRADVEALRQLLGLRPPTNAHIPFAPIVETQLSQ